MKPAYLVIGAVALAGALSACSGGGVDGFPDQHTKELAWDAYNCDNFGRLTAKAHATDINLKILWGEIPQQDIAEAKRWVSKLQDLGVETVADAMEYTSGEGYTNLCSGWLWEWHKSQEDYWEGFDSFDIDTAREAGIVTEQ